MPIANLAAGDRVPSDRNAPREADPPNNGKAGTGREVSDASTDRLRPVLTAARMEVEGGCNMGNLSVAWHVPAGILRGAGQAGRVADPERVVHSLPAL